MHVCINLKFSDIMMIQQDSELNDIVSCVPADL